MIKGRLKALEYIENKNLYDGKYINLNETIDFIAILISDLKVDLKSLTVQAEYNKLIVKEEKEHYLIEYHRFNNLYYSDIFLKLGGYCIIQNKDKDLEKSREKALKWINDNQ